MGIGTLKLLLEYAHDELDRDPGQALAIATFVCEEVERVQVSPALAIIHHRVRGTAWKEYGTALFMAGEMLDARRAAERAIAALAEPGLVLDRAAAQLLLALVQNAMRDHDAALASLAESQIWCF